MYPHSLIRVIVVHLHGSLDPWLPIKRLLKTLIRLRNYAVWSESSMGAHTNLYRSLDIDSWPRGYKTWVQPQTQNKAQRLAGCGHVSQSLRFILSLRNDLETYFLFFSHIASTEMTNLHIPTPFHKEYLKTWGIYIYIFFFFSNLKVFNAILWVIVSRSRICGLEPHRRHSVVSLIKTQYSLLSTGSTQGDPSWQFWKLLTGT